MTNLVLGILLGLGFLAAMRFAGYHASRRDIGRAYRELARRWDGVFDAGSFLRPPRLRFAVGATNAVLSAFYLHEGRSGNHTQLSFRLPRSFLQVFVVSPDAPSGYALDSARPELAQRLLDSEWTVPMARIEELVGERGIEVRFDGETLSIRAPGLLLDEESLTTFKTAAQTMLEALWANLDHRPAVPSPSARP